MGQSQTTGSSEYPYGVSSVQFGALLKSKRSGGSSDVLLVDVREKREAETRGKVPFTHSVPSGQVFTALQMRPAAFKEKYNFVQPSKDMLIVFLCQRGNRGEAAAETARSLGFHRAVSLARGVDGWKAEFPDQDDDRDDL